MTQEDLQYTRISLNRYTRTEELIMNADSMASITTMQPEKHLIGLPWWYYPYQGANESGFMKKKVYLLMNRATLVRLKNVRHII